MSRKTVRIPPVEFARKSSPAEEAGDVVRRRGVIFRAGDYSHQNFSMSPDELRALAKSFKDKVPVDLGHPASESPLDGTLGDLESVEVSPDGTTLYGVAAFPRWLEDRLGDARRSVSVSFDRATKAIRRLSLVTRPQISDAELQAAFACACNQSHTDEEEDNMAGESNTDDRRARARKLVEDMDEDTLAVMLGEDEGDGGTDDDTDDGRDYDPGEDHSELDPVAAPGLTVAQFSAVELAEARIAELEAKDRRRDAEVFVDGAIKDNLVLPAERARLVARHAQFALIEQTAPAEFSADGRPLKLVADFEADIRARPAHTLTRDLIGTAEFARGRHALSSGAESGEETPEQRQKRIDKRLANTPLGQTILARRNGHK